MLYIYLQPRFLSKSFWYILKRRKKHFFTRDFLMNVYLIKWRKNKFSLSIKTRGSLEIKKLTNMYLRARTAPAKFLSECMNCHWFVTFLPHWVVQDIFPLVGYIPKLWLVHSTQNDTFQQFRLKLYIPVNKDTDLWAPCAISASEDGPAGRGDHNLDFVPLLNISPLAS